MQRPNHPHALSTAAQDGLLYARDANPHPRTHDRRHREAGIHNQAAPPQPQAARTGFGAFTQSMSEMVLRTITPGQRPTPQPPQDLLRPRAHNPRGHGETSTAQREPYVAWDVIDPAGNLAPARLPSEAPAGRHGSGRRSRETFDDNHDQDSQPYAKRPRRETESQQRQRTAQESIDFYDDLLERPAPASQTPQVQPRTHPVPHIIETPGENVGMSAQTTRPAPPFNVPSGATEYLATFALPPDRDPPAPPRSTFSVPIFRETAARADSDSRRTGPRFAHRPSTQLNSPGIRLPRSDEEVEAENEAGSQASTVWESTSGPPNLEEQYRLQRQQEYRMVQTTHHQAIATHGLPAQFGGMASGAGRAVPGEAPERVDADGFVGSRIWNTFNALRFGDDGSSQAAEDERRNALLFQQRVCARCGDLFTNMETTGKLRCRMHPRAAAVDGTYPCCGMPSPTKWGKYVRQIAQPQGLLKTTYGGCQRVDHVNFDELLVVPLPFKLPLDFVEEDSKRRVFRIFQSPRDKGTGALRKLVFSNVSVKV
jgi:hypothetical protein